MTEEEKKLIEKFHKRVTCWSNEVVIQGDIIKKGYPSVIYHDAYHAGMVSMAKEAKIIMDLLEGELK